MKEIIEKIIKLKFYYLNLLPINKKLFDDLHYLRELAFEYIEKNPEMGILKPKKDKINIPEFVSLSGIALCKFKNQKRYYRHAGEWFINYKIIDNKIITDCPENPHLHEIQLKEISKKEWEESNKGYI